MADGKKKLNKPISQLLPVTDPEARENQLISAAFNRVEERILDGSATAQELVFFLKLGCTKTSLEKEKLKKDIALQEAKTDAIKSAEHAEELYLAAVNAMKEYSGNGDDNPSIL